MFPRRQQTGVRLGQESAPARHVVHPRGNRRALGSSPIICAAQPLACDINATLVVWSCPDKTDLMR
jgi:hypothetical protein